MRSSLTLLLFALLWPAFAVAQAYRDNLPLPLNEILQNMSTYCESQDFEHLKKAMVLLNPVSQALSKQDAQLESDMDKAVLAKDATAALVVVHRLAWADVRELFAVAEKAEGGEAARHVKAAFLDYAVISPTVQIKNFPADQHIKNSFKHASAADLAPAERHALFVDIFTNIVKAYPVLK